MLTFSRKSLAASVLMLYCNGAHSDISITTTLVSDYLFNGISQTNENPTLQASFDWAGDSGWYAGSFASGVDYGQGTNYELDFYGGYTGALTESLNFELGAAAYTYMGSSVASDFNYIEVYGALDYGNTRLQGWYTNDYFGSSARHYIIALSHNFVINDDVSLLIHVDRSRSIDTSDFEWDLNDDDYMHYKAEAAFEWLSLSWTVGLEKTDLDYDLDVKGLVTAGYTFNL